MKIHMLIIETFKTYLRQDTDKEIKPSCFKNELKRHTIRTPPSNNFFHCSDDQVSEQSNYKVIFLLLQAFISE